MTSKVLNNSPLSVEKLRATLQTLRERAAATNNLSEILGESLAAFKKFFEDLGDPDFSPHYLDTGDTPRSTTYNLNLSQLDSDLDRFYKEISSLAAAHVASFNYASVANEEIRKRADRLASTVLDLKILSDFTRGDVLIAGDDFRTLDNVDTSGVGGAPSAEKLYGSGGMALKKIDSLSVTHPGSKVDILPLSPASSRGGTVNNDPTPGNLQRFYEGNYYNFLGQARPEGGKFNIQYLLSPVKRVGGPATTNGAGGSTTNQQATNDPEHTETVEQEGNTTTTTSVQDDSARYSNENAGYFVELGADEETKLLARTKMFDNDPSTFWEAEYVYHTPRPLISDFLDEAAIEADTNEEDKGHKDNLPRTASVVIDYKVAEQAAKAFDYEGRDLIFDVVVTLEEQQSINYVVVDPILFGANSFIEVLSVETANEDDGQFTIVDGWDANKYAKTITPEANEYLNDTQVGQLMSPSRFEYTGLGVFPFPPRVAKKVRVRLKMDNPVASIYERYYIMLRNQLDMSTEIKTTTKKGILRF